MNFLELLSNVFLGLFIIFSIMFLIIVIGMIVLILLAVFSPDWFMVNIRIPYENTLGVKD